mgnify:CR=1 FL=1
MGFCIRRTVVTIDSEQFFLIIDASLSEISHFAGLCVPPAEEGIHLVKDVPEV